MPIRTLVHRETEWTLWNVVPSLENRLRIPLSSSTGEGWLCIQSAAEKRRVVPAPEGWDEWPDERLAELIERAEVVAAPPRLTRTQTSDSRQRSVVLEEQMDETLRRARELRGGKAHEPEVMGDDGWLERGPEESDDRFGGYASH
jgi:hypothetical protein